MFQNDPSYDSSYPKITTLLFFQNTECLTKLKGKSTKYNTDKSNGMRSQCYIAHCNTTV